MANKKSFILFIDSLNILDKMTDEQAGIFIKCIYEYQLTGKINKIDFAIEMAITPFINQFVRDNEKYINICERNKSNGKKGGRPESNSLIEPIKSKESKVKVNNPKQPKKPTGLNSVYLGYYEKLKPLFIEKSLPSNKNQLEKWVNDIDKMINKDGYSFERIQEIIVYLRSDASFWNKNFHSLLKLRKPLKSQDIKLIDYIDNILKNESKVLPSIANIENDNNSNIAEKFVKIDL